MVLSSLSLQRINSHGEHCASLLNSLTSVSFLSARRIIPLFDILTWTPYHSYVVWPMHGGLGPQGVCFRVKPQPNLCCLSVYSKIKDTRGNNLKRSHIPSQIHLLQNNQDVRIWDQGHTAVRSPQLKLHLEFCSNVFSPLNQKITEG